MKSFFGLFAAAFLSLLLFCPLGNTNQIGATFSEGSIGALADYETLIRSWEFSADVQAQKSEALSLVSNMSVQYNVNDVGLKPFVSYSRDDIGNIVDIGGLVNFSFGNLDIAGGASFRGADPVGSALEERYNSENEIVEVHAEGYDPNTYQLPDLDNINFVLHGGFEKSNVETDLVGYFPITKRDLAPKVIISRSQTSLELTEGLSASVVLDARTYIHPEGVELQFTPMGSITLRF